MGTNSLEDSIRRDFGPLRKEGVTSGYPLSKERQADVERNGRNRKGGGGGYSVCAWPHFYGHRPSHPYYAGTEHVGFSPTRETLLAPSTKRREVFGESHEGRTAYFQDPLVRRTSGTLRLLSCLWMTAPVSYTLFSGVVTPETALGIIL